MIGWATWFLGSNVALRADRVWWFLWMGGSLLIVSLLPRRMKPARVEMILFLGLELLQAVMMWHTRQCLQAAEHLGGTVIRAEGIVSGSRPTEHGMKLSLRQVHAVDGERRMPFGKADVYTKKTVAVRPFQRLEFSAEVAVPQRAGNEGNFDEFSYLRSQGIFLKLRNAGLHSAEYVSRTHRLFGGFSELCEKALGTIRHPQAGSISRMVLTGRTDAESTELKEMFSAAGISHVLVISGLHLIFLAGLFYKFLCALHLTKRTGLLLSTLILFFYLYFIGFGASAVRAFGMFFLSAAAFAMRRTYDTLSALAGMFILSLATNPYAPEAVGFVLSYSAVCVVQAASYQTRKHGRWKRMFTMAFYMFVLSMPVVAYMFYEVPVYSMPANLAVVPLLSPVLLLTLCGVLAYPVSPYFAELILAASSLFIHAAVFITERIASLPGAVWTVGRISVFRVGAFYAFLWIAAYPGQAGACAEIMIRRCNGVLRRCFRRLGKLPDRRRKRRKRKKRKIPSMFPLGYLQRTVRYCMPFFAVLLIFIQIPDTELKIDCLDVGQGDGIVIRHGGETILVDGGSTDVKGVGTYRILPYLRYHGIRTVDWAFLTHLHLDHYSGLEELLQQGRIRRLVLTDYGPVTESFLRLTAAAETTGTEVYRMVRGDRLQIGKLQLECLHPPKGFRSDNPNAYSMTLLLQKGSFQAVLTGDLEAEQEMLLLEGNRLPGRTDFLKVGHHGSSTSTTEAWLRRLRPTEAVISCARKNRFGHPAQEVVRRLKQYGVRTHFTMESGRVSIAADRHPLEVDQYRRKRWND